MQRFFKLGEVEIVKVSTTRDIIYLFIGPHAACTGHGQICSRPMTIVNNPLFYDNIRFTPTHRLRHND